MMPKLSAVCAAVLVLLAVPVVEARDVTSATASQQSLAAELDKLISPHYKADAPGATVIVVKDGTTVFRKAYGLADIARKVPLTPETSLRLGSITKQFTAVGILLLAEEGKLSVQDDITKYLPGYPTHGKKISIEHLLTHTSGIVSYTGKPGYVETMARDMPVSAMIDSFKNDPLEFDPGSRYKYNNSGYFLLGAIIEKVSGQPYAKFLEQRIFLPLQMHQTAYEGHERGAGPRALGHSPQDTHFGPSQPLSMTQPYAAGALVSSVDDLARWDAALSSGKLLKEASWKQATTPYRLSTGKPNTYGYGWDIDKLQGAPMVAHGGAINGFNTFALRLPADQVYVAVLSNTDSGMARSDLVAKKAAALAIGKPYPEYKKLTLDTVSLDAYAGTYELQELGQRIVRRDKDTLVFERPGRGALPLSAFAQDAFFLPGGLDHVKFSRDAKGAVTNMIFYRDGNPVTGQRTGAAPPERKTTAVAHAAFDARVGRYQLRPNFVIELSREGDQFFAQATGQPRLEIYPASETVFFSKAVNAELHFEQGNNSSLTLKQNGLEIAGRKL